MLFTQEWNDEFMQRVNIWAKSFEWLNEDISFLRDPYLSTIKMTIEPLGICAIEV